MYIYTSYIYTYICIQGTCKYASFICKCMYVCIYVCMYYMYVYTHVCIYTYGCRYVYIRMYNTYILRPNYSTIRMYSLATLRCMYYIYVYTHVCIYTYGCRYVYIRMYSLATLRCPFRIACWGRNLMP